MATLGFVIANHHCRKLVSEDLVLASHCRGGREGVAWDVGLPEGATKVQLLEHADTTLLNDKVVPAVGIMNSCKRTEKADDDFKLAQGKYKRFKV